MKIAVSPANDWIVPSSAVALSSNRSEVVPTATMRPPLALAAFAQRGLQRGREMQTRRRGCDRALVGREHGLIIRGIALIGRALGGDVRRQRRATQIGDRRIERGTVKRKRQRDLAIVTPVLDLRV